MTTPSFPILAGQGWSVHKRPTFATRVAAHISGREARMPFYAYPLYEFELTFDGLSSGPGYPGLGASSLQSLLGLYLQCQGQFGTFLYTDPSDNAAVGQAIAVGDGATQSFPFVRTLGGFAEPVGWVSAIQHIYINGVAQATGWTLSAPNILTFGAAPVGGSVISADFTFAFQCRFLDDQNDFENIMSGLWQVQSLKFRSVRP